MNVCLLWLLCVLPGRGLCDGLITRPEESYRLWCPCVWLCNLRNEEAQTRKGCKCQIEEEEEEEEELWIYFSGFRHRVPTCWGNLLYPSFSRRLGWINLLDRACGKQEFVSGTV
jgi:hypothetical protein